MKKKQHKTWHSDVAIGGQILCGCENCLWREGVEVEGLNWVRSMERIFAARDKHEAETVTNSPCPATNPVDEKE